MTDKKSKIKDKAKSCYKFLLISISLFFLVSVMAVFAQVPPDPGVTSGGSAATSRPTPASAPTDLHLVYPWSETTTPAGLVARFYQIALGLVGGAALVVIIAGAIIRVVSAGNTSRISMANEWIKGAIWGVVLLLGSYLILNTINPALVELRNPNLETIQSTPPQRSGITDAPRFISPTTPGAVGVAPAERLSASFVRSQFFSAGIGAKSECSAGAFTNCVSLQGLTGATYNEILNLRGCTRNATGNVLCGQSGQEVRPVFITGGTEAGHNPGEQSHANGNKFDTAPNPELDSYIRTFPTNGTRRDFDGEQLPIYRNPQGGAIYVFEPRKTLPSRAIRGAHWDVLVGSS